LPRVIVLVRHGQTRLNAEGRLAGRLDVPLTDIGEVQAKAAAEAVLARRAPARVVSSPLLRARQTAAAFGLPVEVDERWIELDYGAHDGVALTDIPEQFWTAWRGDPAWAPDGGESLLAVGERVRQACEELCRSLPADDDVVVVSHVSPIKAAVAWALGVGDETSWRLFLAPGSITVIGCAERGPSLRTFNDTSHLGATTW